MIIRSLGVCALLGALVIASPTRAQQTTAGNTGEIHGQILVAPEGQALRGAEVTLRLDSDTALVARTATDGEGRYRFLGLALRQYRIQVAHAGHAPHTTAVISLSADRPSASVDPVRLSTVVALEGLEVRAERPPVVHAEDRNVYRIQDMPAASGGATDVMRTIPELEVDLNGNVTMVGNRNVTIHLNGRPSPLRGEALQQFLQQLPADRIDRVEVIPNPSVRYDSGGPIVNVVLKKDVKLGLSGSLSLNGATRGGTGPSGQVAFQQGKLTLFGGMASRFNRDESQSRELRQNLRARPITFLDQDQRWEGRSAYGSADLTVELEVGQKETIWGSVSGSLSDRERTGLSYDQLLDESRVADEQYNRHNDQGSGNRDSDVAIGFRRIVEAQRHELSIELRRSAQGGDRDGRVLRETTMRRVETAVPWTELRLTDSDNEQSTLTAKLDYSRPFGKKLRMEAGYRTRIDETREENLLQVFSPQDASAPLENAGYGITYRDTEHSAYVTLTRSLGNISVQGGVRGQQALMQLRARDFEEIQNDRAEILPSANVSYKFGEGGNVRVAYSRGLWRPFLGWLNPYVLHVDTLNRTVGNPYLKPDVIHSFTADFSMRTKMGTFRLSPYVRHVDDESFYIRTVDEKGVSTGTPQNIASVTSYGSSLNVSGRPRPNINLSATVGGSHQSRDGGDVGQEYSGEGSQFYGSGNATVKLGAGWDLQTSLRKSSPHQSLQGRYSTTLWSDFGVKKSLWGEKGSISLRVADPFDIHRFSFEGRDPSFVSSSRSRSSFGARSASVSLTYRFGKAPTRKSTPATRQGGDTGPGEGGPPGGP